MKSISERVKDEILLLINAEGSLNAHQTLRSLGIDSLDKVELAMALEEAFDIEIKDGEEEDWRTVGDVIQFCQNRLN